MSYSNIGILTSGGDCSGLNSVIRSALIRANVLGYGLIGFRRGLQGIVHNDIVKLNYNEVDNALWQSGSILLSNTKQIVKDDKSAYTPDELCKEIEKSCDAYNIKGIIFIGGNGSIRCISKLFEVKPDLPIVVVPKTIDNDVANTDFSVGFFTSIETVSNAISNIRSTAISHERTIVVEVMGRDAGYIAMYAGVTSGADAILVPEFKYDNEKLLEHVKMAHKQRGYCIVVVAESVESESCKNQDVQIGDGFSRTRYSRIGEYFANFFKQNNLDSRSVVIGHTQRGGTTSIMDRILASAFGYEAVNNVVQGNFRIMLSYSKGCIIGRNITDVAKCVSRRLDQNDMCVQIAKNLNIYIGDYCITA